ncbi:hypothetical protein R0011_09388 [Lacticaseibacillus rhamnosus R0011]|nr:Hypothetical protein LOCK900_0589 [Lacticaseibacillus rhamnosus LOCK900]ASY49543.1 hypothetical protein N507_2373 [Lacticaseibacillus rhamnosus DSM 14870]EHJ22292.1 hypothetical protein R0011_09388 [Lacticaseibacillus rhamnosus R0011]EHJ28383.1 hypothetical protein HMPREF0541_02192 [Lacticaseibacillus rhamnosus ATCC 21052]
MVKSGIAMMTSLKKMCRYVQYFVRIVNSLLIRLDHYRLI